MSARRFWSLWASQRGMGAKPGLPKCSLRVKLEVSENTDFAGIALALVGSDYLPAHDWSIRATAADFS